MVVIGGKHSSNTKQLYNIAKKWCSDSYLIENDGGAKEGLVYWKRAVWNIGRSLNPRLDSPKCY